MTDVIQAVEPWLSEAIEKGAQWRDHLNAELEKSRIGVCCLTRENLKAEWILFEAGAVSKTKDASLCTFLHDIKPSDVSGPLAAFQHTVPTFADVKKLLQLINAAVQRAGEKALTEERLHKNFERAWPELEAALDAARKVSPPSKKAERSERDLLEEILERVRRLEADPTNEARSLSKTFERELARLRGNRRGIAYVKGVLDTLDPVPIEPSNASPAYYAVTTGAFGEDSRVAPPAAPKKPKA